MASNLDKERLLARIGINLVITRVSGISPGVTSVIQQKKVNRNNETAKIS